ncbi:hypothetical protein KKR91_10600 [Arthrobacter jiangjiafuii]|uniref:Uncharacterized protein n=1 Tax=Arthrobacter jiangjiafuii TaxID=2817475 RepID=A0A975M2Y4_9MICC|nr:hypothetical protein [Arthrobacter jiangjiafuii]MBP3043455.1 hypothetical protein [Arthrobacter jiangjiafuii]QWC08980.1 hypothetical protein KKR91_10600 [Arthrobacter jiangjiafuii]
MTDLQCPATVVLLANGAPPPPWLARLPVAAADIAEALRRHGLDAKPPALVAVDSSGWTLLQDS